MKRSLYATIGLLLGLSLFWGCGKKPQIVVSTADLAASAWLQKHFQDTCLSKALYEELMALRDAESSMSSTIYKTSALSVGRCCPCPPTELADSCQCDVARYYVSAPGWNSSITIMGEKGEITELIQSNTDRGIVKHELKAKLAPGNYTFRIAGDFGKKATGTYELRVRVDDKGKIFRSN